MDRTDAGSNTDPFEDEDYQIMERKRKLSFETEHILTRAVTSTLDNSARIEIRGRYTVQESDFTCIPRLDDIFIASESKFQKHGEAKSVESDLLHITTCTLDVIRPLVGIIEGVNSGELTPADLQERAVDALSLLGNAVAHTSQIRRRRIIKVCNPDISSLAENKELYTKSPLMLFGEGFELKVKERAETLKVLHKNKPTFPQGGQSRPPQYFRNDRPSYTPKEEAVIDTGDIQSISFKNARPPLTQPSTRRTSKAEYSPEWPTIRQYSNCNKYLKMYKIKAGVQGNVTRDVSQFPTCWKTKTLPPQLGKTISGPVGPSDNKGGRNRIYGHTSPKCKTLPTDMVRDRFKSTSRGNNLNVEQRGDNKALGKRRSKRVLFKHVSSPEKRREDETLVSSSRLKKVESICPPPSLQDGKYTNSQRASPTKRVDDKNRSEGCVLHSTNTRSSPK